MLGSLGRKRDSYIKLDPVVKELWRLVLGKSLGHNNIRSTTKVFDS